MLNYLNAASNGFVKANGTVEYYRVNWSDVIDLVRTRRVYLEKGEAFITSDELISVLGAAFRSNLAQNLVVRKPLHSYMYS